MFIVFREVDICYFVFSDVCRFVCRGFRGLEFS